MPNFDFLQSDKDFSPFSDVVIAAGSILHIDPMTCVLNYRWAMEFAVKWMYSMDKQLVMPFGDRLASKMTSADEEYFG